jgi:hypothetical protein
MFHTILMWVLLAIIVFCTFMLLVNMAALRNTEKKLNRLMELMERVHLGWMKKEEADSLAYKITTDPEPWYVWLARVVPPPTALFMRKTWQRHQKTLQKS